MRIGEPNYKRSITSAKLGSIYDGPVDASTKAGSSDEKDQSSRAISVGKETRKFELTERASKKLPFNTFYSTNLTDYEV